MGPAGAGSALIPMGVGRMVERMGELAAEIRRHTAVFRDILEKARASAPWWAPPPNAIALGAAAEVSALR